MKKHDNTLYVTTQGAYLAREGTNVLVRVEKKTRMRVPVHNLGGIVCFGNVSCSPFVMGLCGREGVGISFLSLYGRFLARVLGPQSGNVLLRRAQHRATSDPAAAAGLARLVITAKIANARTVLQRGLRDHAARVLSELVETAVRRLADLVRELQNPAPLDRLRGIEGDAARGYFVAFDELILQHKQQFFLHGRSRRPPRDRFNALLSFGYALLYQNVHQAILAVGVEPAVGFFHTPRSAAQPLVLDLMELFRLPKCSVFDTGRRVLETALDKWSFHKQLRSTV